MKIVGLCFSTSAPLVALVSKKGGRLAANTVSKWQKYQHRGRWWSRRKNAKRICKYANTNMYIT